MNPRYTDLSPIISDIVALRDGKASTSHAATHAAGGIDPITPAQIGAATAAQGAKADTALQPGAISVASLEVGLPSSGVADLYVGLDGKVGVGTETPSEKLTVSGHIDILGGRVKNLGAPVADTDAATKGFVDAKVAQVYQATFYKTASQNLNNGSTDISFDAQAAWSNPNNYITQGADFVNFVVNRAGLYQLEFNAAVIGNGATWNTGTSKVVSIDITRAPDAEQIVIGQTATIAGGTDYAQNVCSTFRLEEGDVINLRHQGSHATATPFARGVQNSYDLNTWFSWRFIA